MCSTKSITPIFFCFNFHANNLASEHINAPSYFSVWNFPLDTVSDANANQMHRSNTVDADPKSYSIGCDTGRLYGVRALFLECLQRNQNNRNIKMNYEWWKLCREKMEKPLESKTWWNNTRIEKNRRNRTNREIYTTIFVQRNDWIFGSDGGDWLTTGHINDVGGNAIVYYYASDRFSPFQINKSRQLIIRSIFSPPPPLLLFKRIKFKRSQIRTRAK